MQFYAACALHEMGHILAACLVGVRIKSVVFSGGGIRMLTDRASVVTNCENVLMLLSGPAVNLFLAAALSIHGAVGDFAMLNLAAGLYNLLPFSLTAVRFSIFSSQEQFTSASGVECSLRSG